MPTSGAVEGIIEAICRGLVERPEAVEVTSYDRYGTLRVDVRVAQGDVGKVVGRHGRVADALRTVAEAIAGPGQAVHIDFGP